MNVNPEYNEFQLCLALVLFNFFNEVSQCLEGTAKVVTLLMLAVTLM